LFRPHGTHNLPPPNHFYHSNNNIINRLPRHPLPNHCRRVGRQWLEAVQLFLTLPFLPAQLHRRRRQRRMAATRFPHQLDGAASSPMWPNLNCGYGTSLQVPTSWCTDSGRLLH
jgi:hypothetical protein